MEKESKSKYWFRVPRSYYKLLPYMDNNHFKLISCLIIELVIVSGLDYVIWGSEIYYTFHFHIWEVKCLFIVCSTFEELVNVSGTVIQIWGPEIILQCSCVCVILVYGHVLAGWIYVIIQGKFTSISKNIFFQFRVIECCKYN